ncbi:hypothetical protein [Streptomyces sp. NPDC006645]|uniref:hypothetical protein n=1 Tax=unclassified Streptomyces TaxID=2593676 RepID=UPI0033B7A212
MTGGTFSPWYQLAALRAAGERADTERVNHTQGCPHCRTPGVVCLKAEGIRAAWVDSRRAADSFAWSGFLSHTQQCAACRATGRFCEIATEWKETVRATQLAVGRDE